MIICVCLLAISTNECICGCKAISINSLPFVLTHNVESHKIAAHRLRWYLAFIHASVTFLRPFYLQRPVVAVLMMCRLETLIRGVRVCTNGEYVYVTMPYPWNLYGRGEKKKCKKNLVAQPYALVYMYWRLIGYPMCLQKNVHDCRLHLPLDCIL